MVLLPLAIALSLAIGIVLDPVRTFGAFLIGVRDRSTGDTISAATIWSIACAAAYAIFFHLIDMDRFESISAHLFWALVAMPAFTVYVSVVVNWTRRAPRLHGLD